MNIWMIILLILLCIFLLFVLVCLFVTIKIKLSFKKKSGEKFDYDFKFEILGDEFDGDLKSLLSDEEFYEKLEKIRQDTLKEQLSEEQTLQKLARRYYQQFQKLKYTLSKVRNSRIKRSVYAEKINVNITVGLEDAAKTGMSLGAIWAGIYDIVAFIASIITVNEPEITVTPDYQNERAEIEGILIVDLHIIDILQYKIICWRRNRRFYKSVRNKAKNKIKSKI